jgi:hypothetical protein
VGGECKSASDRPKFFGCIPALQLTRPQAKTSGPAFPQLPETSKILTVTSGGIGIGERFDSPQIELATRF